jgi:signal transduction histidine kinase
MELIQDFFRANQEIIYFVYGLMFFVLGLAIALQSRHSSRLDLARSLKWLALFGFLHGFNEWGDLFIPLQAAYLAPSIIRLLQYLHLFLLAASFICLFAFGAALLPRRRRAGGMAHGRRGAALLEPIKHYKALHVSLAILLLAWLVIILGPFRLLYSDFNTWYNATNAMVRYLICLPGGFLTAYALRQHTLRLISPYNVPRIVRALQAAGVSMALYALAGGLIVPPVPFFPGNWLNTDVFTRLLIFPPQLLRALIGLAMAATTIRVLEVFGLETSRQIEAMEQRQILAAERERIARELHDGTIQKVYTAGLLVRSAQNLTEPESPLAGRLATAVGVLDDAIGDLRQHLGELNAPALEQEPFASALGKLASDPRFSSLVKVAVDLKLPESDSPEPERAAHILAIAQEALANAVRHAKARHILVAASRLDDRLELKVLDDGTGLPEQVREGHGLRNMRDRASLLRGELQVERLNRGTCVSLNIPWRLAP